MERGANMQGGFGAVGGAQSLEAAARGHASGYHHLENARQVGHKRFGSLPKIGAPSSSTDPHATKPAEVTHASVDDAAAKTILARNSEIWSSNFTVARPKDHIKHNIVKVLREAPQLLTGPRRALSTYRGADRLQAEKKKL